MNKAYQPAQALTIKANINLAAFRFIGFDGNLCTANAKAFGVSDKQIYSGENSCIYTLGTIPIETSGAVNLGDDIASDTDGKAKTASVGAKVNGRALESCTSASIIKILLVP